MQNKSVIRQIFYANNDKKETKITDEYKNLLNDIVCHEKQLIDKIRDLPDLLKLYKEIDFLSAKLDSETACTHYVEGFKFGFLLCLEAIQNKSQE